MPGALEPRLSCRPAQGRDATDIRAIQAAAAAALTERHGAGHWSTPRSLGGIRTMAREGLYHLVQSAGVTVATFRLTPRRIGFYHLEWFAEPGAPAGYLLDLAVHPAWQGRGIGRFAMAQAEALCRAGGMTALRLDAYRGPAGAGPFYVKCGCRLVHCGAFRSVSLDYYEKVLALTPRRRAASGAASGFPT